MKKKQVQEKNAAIKQWNTDKTHEKVWRVQRVG